MNEGVTAAVSVLYQIDAEFAGWAKHKLSAASCMRTPHYPSSAGSDESGGTLLPQRICCGQGDMVGTVWQQLAPESAKCVPIRDTSTVQVR